MSGYRPSVPGGICLIHGPFGGNRCALCVERERERLNRPRLVARILARLFSQ